MSHLTTAPAKCLDIDALRAAARHFGGELIEAKTFSTYQHGQKCDYAITLPNVRYQVGVRKEKTGEYTLHFDPFSYDENNMSNANRHDGSKLVKAFGKGLNLLTQRCAAETVLKAARRKGVLCEMKTLSNGNLQLRMAV